MGFFRLERVSWFAAFWLSKKDGGSQGVIFSGIMTFILLKIVGIFVPLRLSDEELEIGDHAIHGNEVYPSDVPTLGGPHAPAWRPDPAPSAATTTAWHRWSR